MHQLADIAADWDRAARQDAMANIRTDRPHWEAEDFFATGEREIAEVLAGVETKRESALDFGCGVGRLTEALAKHFKVAVGVDVSAEMIDQAHGDAIYLHNDSETLPFDDQSFNFAYSSIVLQHMPSELAKGYITELLRVAEVSVFQIPEGPNLTQSTAPWLSMYGTPRGEIEELVADAGAELLTVDDSDASGPMWQGWRYTVRV